MCWTAVLLAACGGGAYAETAPEEDGGTDRGTDAGPALDAAARLPPPWPSTAPRFTAVAVGIAHGCGLTETEEVWCWGSDRSGQLGEGLVHRHECGPPERSAPCRAWAEPVPGLGGVVQIAGDGNTVCALLADGVVRCPGARRDPLPGAPPLTQIAVGGGSVYGVAADGSAWRWLRYARVERVDVPPVARIAAATGHACALSLAGEVICWGDNFYGQLGQPWDLGRDCDSGCEVSGG